MEQQRFQGPRWESQRRISLIEEDSIKRLFLNGHPYMNWSVEDDLSPRLAIAQLYGLEMGTQEDSKGIWDKREIGIQLYSYFFCKGSIWTRTAEEWSQKQLEIECSSEKQDIVYSIGSRNS